MNSREVSAVISDAQSSGNTSMQYGFASICRKFYYQKRKKFT